MPGRLIIGTRGSRLALAQAAWVRDRLLSLHPGLSVSLEVVHTSGDRLSDRPLPEIGGKGLFTAELEEALRGGGIHVAVHSLKDLPTGPTEGLCLAAVPLREDPRDCLVSRGGLGLDDLPRGARVGTSSLRRAALLRSVRPDLEVLPLRGNVDTRLARVDSDELDASVLAVAGLRRLGLGARAARPLDPEAFPGAPGQGALALQTRPEGDARRLASALHHVPTARAVEAERALLATLEAGCQAPVGALALETGEGRLRLVAAVVSPDGRRSVRGVEEGPASEAAALGNGLARRLLDGGAAEVVASARGGAAGERR
ncbi:MAG: hydroxymethylbilane synthase [Planctomycetes bacterium]|nr:hydroxymethylbilane synthase [Planctomycetota bacterium]